MNKIVEAITPAHLNKKLDRGARDRFFLFHSRHRPVSHESVPAARPMVSGHALCENTRADVSRNWACCSRSKRSPSHRAASCWWRAPPVRGKSTTLAAMIEHINSNFKKHIITLEDPIEYVFEDNQSVIEQREIGLDTLSYPSRPQARSAAGPGHHHGRRNARRRQLCRGHERGGHGPFGAVHAAHHHRGLSVTASWIFSRRRNANKSAGNWPALCAAWFASAWSPRWTAK